MSAEIHVNDIGTRILVRFSDICSPLDFTGISSVASLSICFKPPTGALKTLAATYAALAIPSLCGTVFTGTGSDGWTEVTIVSSAFWDEPGDWKLQGRVIGTQGDNRSDVKTFSVFGNICL